MEKFVWTEEYSVGVPSLDEQHKQFFAIANHLIDLLNEKNITKEVLVQAVKKMTDYAAFHLGTEEGYFDKVQYDNAQDHLKAHDIFRGRVGHYNKMLEDPNANFEQLADEVATYAIYWLSEHILLVDKQYTVFLQQKGIQ